MRVKNKNVICLLGVVLLAILTAGSVFAQEDEQGSNDHPLVSRFEGAVIKFYKETKWGSYQLPINEKGAIDWGKPQTLEGKVTRIQYTTSTDNNSEFVLQNYKTAFKKAGFRILISIANEKLGVSDRPHTWGDKYYESGGYYNGLNNLKFGMGINLPIWKNNHAFIAAKGNSEGKDIYAIIYIVVDDKYTLITQDVIEVEAVETGMVKVNAEALAKDIEQTGHASIYGIYFDTGKADVKPQSEEALAEIAKLLKQNPTLKLYVVGHTDNVGTLSSNMELSQRRAEAVVKTLVSKHVIDIKRLHPAGVGPLTPVTSNKTEEGRAKNRRVELVKQ